MEENQKKSTRLDFKSLCHPTENSRFQLFVASFIVIILYLFILALIQLLSWLGLWYMGIQEFSTVESKYAYTDNYLFQALTSLLFFDIGGLTTNLLGFIGSWLFLWALILIGIGLWIRARVLEQRFLNQAIEVNQENFPETWQLFEEIKKELGYEKPLTLYLIESDKLKAEVKKFYRKTRIVLHSELVQQMINQKKTKQLTWILGSLIGSVQAKYYRLAYLNFGSSFSLIDMLDNVELLKVFNIFIYPYQRATVYSGDQIGFVVCGDLSASVLAMNRILVGNDLSTKVDASSIAKQATQPSSKFFSALSRLFARSPRPVKRVANLLAFAQKKHPEQYEAYVGEQLSQETHTKLAEFQKDDRKGFFMKAGAVALALLLLFGISQIFDGEAESAPTDLTENLSSEIIEKYDMVFTGNAEGFDGLIPATKDERIGLINRNGKEITPIKYQRIFYPSDGLARVYSEGKFGFINKQGKEVIALAYDAAENFVENKAEVEKDGKTFIINRKGKCVEKCP